MHATYTCERYNLKTQAFTALRQIIISLLCASNMATSTHKRKCSLTESVTGLFSRKQKEKKAKTYLPPLLADLPSEFLPLQNDGVQVLQNVLSPEACKDLISQCWRWLADMNTGILQGSPETWRSPAWPANLHGIMQHSRTGHAQWVWDVRQNPAVVDIFSRLWSCDPTDLIVSFDAVCIMRPPEFTGGRFRSSDDCAKWIHTDQASNKMGRWCIQGLITLDDMDSDDGTLAVYKQGHTLHEEVFKHFGVYTRSDWYKFSDEELAWLKSHPGVHEHHVQAPAGSLVLWDSRVPHCNIVPAKSRAAKGRFRYVVYVCMMPRKFADKRALKTRQKAMKDLRLTNHWPIFPKLFPKMPRTYGQTLPDYSVAVSAAPNLTPLGRSLAGLD